MEFHITFSGGKPDPMAIEHAIRAFDPAALVDVDPSINVVRVATSIDGRLLTGLLNQAGYPVAPQQVFQVPSTCCGSCSG